MGIVEIVKSLLFKYKKIEIEKLPSQGKFYNDDFQIKISKVEDNDIKEYENTYDRDNLYVVIESVKKIVRKNTILSYPYKFEDIKSIDIIFLFLEIVKFTKGKEIKVSFFNEDIRDFDYIEFSDNTFNYFDFSKYDHKNCEIIINDYKFSMPSIGVENCLTDFLVNKSSEKNSNEWNNYSYDFLFFTCNKNNLTFKEIENLVTIFNFDIDQSEQKKIRKIVNKFNSLISYSLQINGKVIDIKSKLDLETIWK